MLCALLSIGLLTTLVTCYFLLKRIAGLKKELKAQELRHEQEFAEMINKMNHHGDMKEGSTVAGLTAIISLGIWRCINSYRTLFEEKDWNTAGTTTELQAVVQNELAFLNRKMMDFLAVKRQILKDHDKHQGV